MRSDKSECPVFFTRGSDYYWVISGWDEWTWEGVCTSADFESISSDKITTSPQVISREEFLQKLKEKDNMSELFGKVYINLTPETHVALQEEVLKAGGKWLSGADYVKHETYREGCVLSVDPDGTMHRDQGRYLQEAEIEVIKSIKIHPVESEEDKRKKELQQKIEAHQASLYDLKKELEKL